MRAAVNYVYETAKDHPWLMSGAVIMGLFGVGAALNSQLLIKVMEDSGQTEAILKLAKLMGRKSFEELGMPFQKGCKELYTYIRMCRFTTAVPLPRLNIMDCAADIPLGVTEKPAEWACNGVKLFKAMLSERQLTECAELALKNSW